MKNKTQEAMKLRTSDKLEKANLLIRLWSKHKSTIKMRTSKVKLALRNSKNLWQSKAHRSELYKP